MDARAWRRKFALQAYQAQKERRKDVGILLSELKHCSSTRNLARGKELHARAIRTGDDSSIYVATTLVNMYAKCKSMVDAHQVFIGINKPNVVSWAALISGYAENREGLVALDMFERMQSHGFPPNRPSFIAALKACTSLAEQEGSDKAFCLKRGKEIHSQIDLHSDIYVQNTLIDMYAKCGSMLDAHEVFNAIEKPSVVSWTALILGYAENGQGYTGLDLYAKMKSQACTPDRVTYFAALKSCTYAVEQDESRRADCLIRGRQIHAEISCESEIFVNTLIDMYGKCGSMPDARQVFEGIQQRDIVSWNALIVGYAENGQGATALDLFARLKSEGCEPNRITYVAALKACSSIAMDQDGNGRAECLARGRQIHSEINCPLDIFVQSTLIDMYANGGSMNEAHQVFDNIKKPNVVSWSALILGYAENGEGVKALDLFARMKSKNCVPNHVTFAAALKACGSLGALVTGIKIHAKIDPGIECLAIVVTCLVDFYAKCGSMGKAQDVFDAHPRSRNMKTWTALLTGYSHLGDCQAAFELLEGMQDAGFQPNRVTCLCILMCCSHAGLVEKASKFFEAMPTTYGVFPAIEHYNSMVDMLGRSNKLDEAMALLRSMPCRPSRVAWLTMLGACGKWKNVGIGRLAFKSLVSLDYACSTAYVLMAQIYGSQGMWEEQQVVVGMRKKYCSWKETGESCWTNEVGEVHTF